MEALRVLKLRTLRIRSRVARDPSLVAGTGKAECRRTVSFRGEYKSSHSSARTTFQNCDRAIQAFAFLFESILSIREQHDSLILA